MKRSTRYSRCTAKEKRVRRKARISRQLNAAYEREVEAEYNREQWRSVVAHWEREREQRQQNLEAWGYE